MLPWQPNEALHSFPPFKQKEQLTTRPRQMPSTNQSESSTGRRSPRRWWRQDVRRQNYLVPKLKCETKTNQMKWNSGTNAWSKKESDGLIKSQRMMILLFSSAAAEEWFDFLSKLCLLRHLPFNLRVSVSAPSLSAASWDVCENH